MKKLLNIALLSLVAAVLFSCDPIEPHYKYEYYYDDIYTVNKHTVSPEFSDSVIPISNMDTYGYQTGDRLHMTLRYFFDISTMSRPLCEIAHVTRKIETRPLAQPGSIDTAEYNAVFNKLDYYEFADRYVNPVWIWKNRQNLNIYYYGIEEGAAFAMAVRGVSEDFVEFDLFAKATRSGKLTNSKLLTFDLSNVADFLTEEQKSSVAGMDSLRTKIYLKREVEGAVKEVNIIGGKFANPVK